MSEDKTVVVGKAEEAIAGTDCVVIGVNARAEKDAHHAVVIGPGGTVTEPYQIVISTGDSSLTFRGGDDDTLRQLLVRGINEAVERNQPKVSGANAAEGLGEYSVGLGFSVAGPYSVAIRACAKGPNSVGIGIGAVVEEGAHHSVVIGPGTATEPYQIVISTGESSLTIRRGEHIEGDETDREFLVRAIMEGLEYEKKVGKDDLREV